MGRTVVFMVVVAVVTVLQCLLSDDVTSLCARALMDCSKGSCSEMVSCTWVKCAKVTTSQSTVKR
jgi:hypothetical protein